jgi:hypothetical protein
MSHPATTSSSSQLFSPVTNSALTDFPSATAPSARSASVSSASTLRSLELSSPVSNNAPAVVSSSAISLAQAGDETSIRWPDIALADQPSNILYDALLNNYVTSFLTPLDVSALSRVSRALYFHVDFTRNPFWVFCLGSEYRLQNSVLGQEPHYISPEQAFDIFAEEPQKRLPQYEALGSLSMRALLQAMFSRVKVPAHLVSRLSRIIAPLQLSLSDAHRLAKLISPCVGWERGIILRARGKTIAQIEKIAAVDLLKEAYRSEVRGRSFHLAKIIALFALFATFYSLEAEANANLDMALDSYDGNLPYMPDRLTSLIFTAFCADMSDAYDVSNCSGLSYQEQQLFKYRWLAIWIATYGSLEGALLLKRVFSSHYNSEPGFKLAVMQYFMLPEKIASLSCLASPQNALNTPLITNEALDHSDVLIGRSQVRCKIRAWVYSFIAIGLAMVSTVVLFRTRDIMQIDAVHEFVDAVCANTTVMNITSLDDLWPSCEAGEYDGKALFDSFESVEEFCSDVCLAMTYPIPAGQAAGISAVIVLLAWMMSLVSLCIMGAYDAGPLKLSTNRFQMFSRSLDDRLLQPGKSDANDDAIANSVLAGAVDVEAGEGEVVNPLVAPEQAYQPPAFNV